MKVEVELSLWRPTAPLARYVWVCALVALMCVTAACSESDEGFVYMRVTVDGEQTLGISGSTERIRGVVVYFHGLDGNEFAMTNDEPHQAVVKTLVDAGFAVVSSNASGNAFGNAKSQQNYRELAQMALGHYHTENVFLLADSMGAVAATNLLASTTDSNQVRGMAAINPVLDLTKVPQAFEAAVAQSYPVPSMVQTANPLELPPTSLAGRKIRFYVSAEDDTVRPEDNALAFQRRFGSVADVSIVDCVGPHGDPSCMQGDDILKFFTALERRV